MNILDPRQFPEVEVSEFEADFPESLKVTLPNPVITRLQEAAEERMKVKRIGAMLHGTAYALSVRNAFEGLCGEYAVASLIPGLTVNVEHYVDGGDGGKGDLSIDEKYNIGVKTRNWYGEYPTNRKGDFKDDLGVLVWRFNGSDTPKEYSVSTPNQLLVVGFFTKKDWDKYSHEKPSFGRWVMPTSKLRHMQVLFKLLGEYRESHRWMTEEEVYTAVGLEPPKPDSDTEDQVAEEKGAGD